jgi:hypothetical protein
VVVLLVEILVGQVLVETAVKLIDVLVDRVRVFVDVELEWWRLLELLVVETGECEINDDAV